MVFSKVAIYKIQLHDESQICICVMIYELSWIHGLFEEKKTVFERKSL